MRIGPDFWTNEVDVILQSGRVMVQSLVESEIEHGFSSRRLVMDVERIVRCAIKCLGLLETYAYELVMHLSEMYQSGDASHCGEDVNESESKGRSCLVSLPLRE